MAFSSSIKVSSIVKKHAPRTEPKADVSSWFLNETIELDFGEYVGRPNKNVLLQKEYLTRFLENGWTISKVMTPNETGNWQSASSETFSSSSESETTNRNIGSVQTSSVETSVENSSTNKVNEGNPYWGVYQRVKLTRRRMQPEKVLNTMVTSFIDSYNSGRKIDNDRFDELMSLCAVVLSQNETDGEKLISRAIDAVSPLGVFNDYAYSTWISLSSAHNKAIGIGTDIKSANIAEVNRKFDALISQSMTDMITNGMYNNTVWQSVRAGIERQRSEALAKIGTEADQMEVSALTSIGTAKASASAGLLEARNAIINALDNRRVTAITLRNNVVKWMMDYLSAKQEVYPELDEISSITERLGFSVGSSGNVL